MTTYYRKIQDPGLENIRPWVEQWIDDSAGINVDAISIDIPFPTRPRIKAFTDLYALASRGRQSNLHVFLKFNLCCWLIQETRGLPDFEKRFTYVDYDDQIERVIEVPDRKKYGRTRKCLLHSYYETYEIIADLYSAGTSLEVGGTSPFNLLFPLLKELTTTAIWVPFPKGYRKKNFDMRQLKQVTGYRFTVSDFDAP